jgi:adenylyltransferase/sulfurtransferase
VDPDAPNLDRYHRQMLLPGVGEAGQRRLLASHALLIGCGALGSTVADLLSRAGVGTITIVDRDLVELTNLQRQTLYTEADARDALPKPIAAQRRLAQVNSTVRIRPVCDDFHPGNAEEIASDLPDAPPVGVIIDGTDNFETRYLLNDLAVSLGVPFVYAGAVATGGMTMTVIPGVTPCLRCVFEQMPDPATAATCDTAGVLGPAVTAIASIEAGEAIKALIGAADAITPRLLTLDLWTNEARSISLAGARRDDCPCCGREDFDFLEGAKASVARTLCGRNSVQVAPASRDASIDLDALAQRLAPHGAFTMDDFLLRGALARERNDRGEPIGLAVFPNGRAIISGTTEQRVAKTIYARYVGA